MKRKENHSDKRSANKAWEKLPDRDCTAFLMEWKFVHTLPQFKRWKSYVDLSWEQLQGR